MLLSGLSTVMFTVNIFSMNKSYNRFIRFPRRLWFSDQNEKPCRFPEWRVPNIIIKIKILAQKNKKQKT